MNLGTKSEQIRAAIIAVANAVFPALVLLDVLDWSAEQIAGVMLVVTTVVTLIFLLIPNAEPPADA